MNSSIILSHLVRGLRPARPFLSRQPRPLILDRARHRFFNTSASLLECSSRTAADTPKACCGSKSPSFAAEPAAPTAAPLSAQFWGHKHTWSRASINTFRCLIGCTLGDFSALFYLQAHHPDLPM